MALVAVTVGAIGIAVARRAGVDGAALVGSLAWLWTTLVALVTDWIPRHVFYLLAVLPGVAALANYPLALRPRYEHLESVTERILDDPQIRSRYLSLATKARDPNRPRWWSTVVGSLFLVVTFLIPASLSERYYGERHYKTGIGIGLRTIEPPSTALPIVENPKEPPSPGGGETGGLGIAERVSPRTRAADAVTGLLYTSYGAYIYVVTEMISRMNSSALSARFLMTGSLRTLTLMLLGFIAGQIGIFASVTTSAQAVFLFFALGLFPNWGFFALQRRVRDFFKPDEDGCQVLPLCLIDGLDDAIVNHLAEFGTWDIQHLATSDPIMLARRTLFPIERLVDWIQQAILISHVRRQIPLFRARGVRGAIDMAALYRDAEGVPESFGRPTKDVQTRANDTFTNLANDTKMSVADLKNVAQSMYEDDLVLFIWRLWFRGNRNITEAIISAAIDVARDDQKQFNLRPAPGNPVSPQLFRSANFVTRFETKLNTNLARFNCRWAPPKPTGAQTSDDDLDKQLSWTDVFRAIHEHLVYAPPPEEGPSPSVGEPEPGSGNGSGPPAPRSSSESPVAETSEEQTRSSGVAPEEVTAPATPAPESAPVGEPSKSSEDRPPPPPDAIEGPGPGS